jgi:hypothetical protein
LRTDDDDIGKKGEEMKALEKEEDEERKIKKKKKWKKGGSGSGRGERRGRGSKSSYLSFRGLVFALSRAFVKRF